MVPGVSPYSIPAGVPLSQMPVVVNLLAIPSEETLPPVQAVEAIPISKAENTMDTKMENMMKAFEAWTFRMSKANEPRYGGYQSARGCAIQAVHPPPHMPMNVRPSSAPSAPASS